jgi:hypothetical protein
MISGKPINFSYSPTAPATVVTNTLTMRPNLVGNPFLPADQRTPVHYFDIAAFKAPDTIVDPATGKRLLASVRQCRSEHRPQRCPVYVRLGHRQILPAISEGRSQEFRAEAFNVLNKTNTQAAGSNISSPGSFGTITKTFPARQIQLALKIVF